MDGIKCSFCNTYDFLPFECSLCHMICCLEHRSRFNHLCKKTDNPEFNNGNTIEETVTDGKNMKEDNAARKDVREMMENIKNRFNSNGTSPISDPPLRLQSGLRIPTGFKPPLWLNQKKLTDLEDIAKSSKNLKEQAIANRTRAILIKNRAIGNDNIELERRVYLRVLFFPTEEIFQSYVVKEPKERSKIETESLPEAVYLYFSNHSTYSEVIQWLSSKHTLSAYQKTVRPDDQTLVMVTEDTPDWTLWQRNEPLSNLFGQVECVFVYPKPIAIVNAGTQTFPPTPPLPPMPITVDESSSTPPRYSKGDLAWYTKNLNVPRVLVRVVGVHLDDYPHVYYTIQPTGAIHSVHNEGSSFREKQTDALHLAPIQSSKGAVEPPIIVGVGRFEPLSFDLSNYYSIRVVHGKIEYNNIFIPKDLKVLASLQLLHLQNAIYEASGVHPSDQKLILQGKILKPTTILLADLNILKDGSKVTLIGNVR